MGKRVIENTIADPTLATTTIKIKGKEYTLCFDMGALAEAELHFRRAGDPINLLNAFPEISLSSVLIIFPCAVRKFHPDLTFKQAREIIGSSLPAIYAVAPFIMQAWKDAMPDIDPEQEKPENPLQP